MKGMDMDTSSTRAVRMDGTVGGAALTGARRSSAA